MSAEPVDDGPWDDGPAAYEPGHAPRSPNDRTPPQDNAAEQSVLGAMLISKDEIANVTEVLRGLPFEGHVQTYLGTTGEVPFRVFRLSDPERLVIDLLRP